MEVNNKAAIKNYLRALNKDDDPCGGIAGENAYSTGGWARTHASLRCAVGGAHRRGCIGAYILLCTLAGLLHPLPALSQTAQSGAEAAPRLARDGQHDFDFKSGTWKTHIRRLQHPLTGSHAWIELNGTVVVRKVWDGRARLEEIEADGTTGHFESLTLFLYNPQSHQWSLNFANSKDGTLSQPSIGEFKDGRGEFFDQEIFNGRAILVRIIWSDITPNSHRLEQSFSDDGGKTWEANFVATLAREKQGAAQTGDHAAGDESDKAR